MNYLEEFKNKNKGTKSAHDFVESVKRKTNMSSSEKAQKILTYVENIEKKAKMREEKGKANNLLLDEELDSLYMEAIEAKLSMLGKE